MIGIYQITNLRSGKIYIGQSLDVLARLRQHKYELRHGLHLNRYLQSAWNRYGESNFVFSVLEEVSEEKLTEREKYWVDFYGGYESDRLYNLREPGPSGRLPACARKKLSDSIKKLWASDSSYYRSAEHSENLSRAAKQSWTPERRAGQSRRMAAKGVPPEFDRTGHPVSEETKRKISQTLTGHPVSEETRQKLREAAKRQPHRKQTDEEKRNRSEKAKAAWARRKANAMEVNNGVRKD